MKTAFNQNHFERRSLEQGQTPLATDRLAQSMIGETQEASCHR
jgi:hypothetical protein